MLLSELAMEAGLPNVVLNMVHGTNVRLTILLAGCVGCFLVSSKSKKSEKRLFASILHSSGDILFCILIPLVLSKMLLFTATTSELLWLCHFPFLQSP